MEPALDAVIRIVKQGLETVGKLTRPVPLLEYAAEVRGGNKKRRTIRMRWTRMTPKGGAAKFIIVLESGPGLKAGLSVEIVTAKEKSIMLDLLRNGSSVERKMVAIRSGKGNAGFGNLGKGIYQLRNNGMPLFVFKIG
jgi:hypothetical protein